MRQDVFVPDQGYRQRYEVLTELGICYENAGCPEKARACFDKARELMGYLAKLEENPTGSPR